MVFPGLEWILIIQKGWNEEITEEKWAQTWQSLAMEEIAHKLDGLMKNAVIASFSWVR